MCNRWQRIAEFASSPEPLPAGEVMSMSTWSSRTTFDRFEVISAMIVSRRTPFRPVVLDYHCRADFASGGSDEGNMHQNNVTAVHMCLSYSS